MFGASTGDDELGGEKDLERVLGFNDPQAGY